MKNLTPLFLVLMLAACAGEGPALFSGTNAPKAEKPASGDPASALKPGTLEEGETEKPADPDAPISEIYKPDPGENNTATTETTAPPKPAPEARTVEELDTTTPAQREAAVAPKPAPSGDGKLGSTVASVGDVKEPGFWIKTPLVTNRTSGRIFYPATGRSVQVQLIPGGGPSGGGSQVSLAAMRLLGADPASLPEVVVYSN